MYTFTTNHMHCCQALTQIMVAMAVKQFNTIVSAITATFILEIEQEKKKGTHKWKKNEKSEKAKAKAVCNLNMCDCTKNASGSRSDKSPVIQTHTLHTCT